MVKESLYLILFLGMIAMPKQLGAAPEEAKGSTSLILPFPERAALTPVASGLSPFQQSPAYKQYMRRPKSELSKLIYLFDRLKHGNFIIIYNNKPYEAFKITTLVKAYVALNYKKEPAATWITNHAYKSRSKGMVIYLQYPSGERRILRDVLLEELNRLPHSG